MPPVNVDNPTVALLLRVCKLFTPSHKKVIEPEKMYASKWSKCVEQWSDLVLPGREGNSMVWIGKA